MMLIIAQKQLELITQHGEATYPYECCGLLAGKKEKKEWIVYQIFPMNNAEEKRKNDRYVINADERKETHKRITSLGLELIGFYHSHPDHDVYFSQTDLESSEEYQFGQPWLPPTYAYLVISIKYKKKENHGAFIVKEGKSQKIDVMVEN